MSSEVLTVVIPFYNAVKTIGVCLEAFERHFPDGIRVIAVDNNSRDGSLEIAQLMADRFPDRFSVMRESRQGPSFARNLGAFAADADLVAFVDADCVPDPHWKKHLLGAFDTPDIAAVAGRVAGYHQDTAVDKFHMMFTMRGDDAKRIHKEFTLLDGGFPTANFAVRRAVFKEIGGFDVSMKIYSEDYDLCARIYKAGYRILYTPDVVIYHQHRSTLKATVRQGFGFGSGHATLLKRHFRQMVIVEGPWISFVSRRIPRRIWMDFNGADKKLFVLMLAAVMWPPLVVGAPVYMAYLYRYMLNRLRRLNIANSKADACLCVLLLIFKSAAITSGRVYGAFMERVVCL